MGFMGRKVLNIAALAAALAIPSFARAEDAKPAEAAAPAAPAPANTLDIHGSAGVTFTTSYVSRGLVLEDKGVIAQPYAELDLTVFKSDTIISSITPFVGIWSSLHSKHTDAGAASTPSGATDTLPSWYEFDWYVGANVALNNNLTITTTYYEFLSPSDAFGTSHNLEFKLAYNDASLWDNKFALNPYAKVFIELDGKAGNGSSEGIYYEIGLAPSFKLIDSPTYPVTFTIPVTVGLGSNDFYANNESFGYASIGGTLSVPLAFIPSNLGAWTLSAGVTFYYLGEELDGFNVPLHRNEDHTEVVGSMGLGMTF
jgi:hypothetical protein